MSFQRALVLLAVFCATQLQSPAWSQDTTSVTSRLENGTDSFLALEVSVPALCTHPVAHVIIANTQNRPFFYDSPASGLAGLVSRYLGYPGTESYETYENGIIGRVPGPRPLIEGLNALTGQVCDAYSGPLLILIGIGPVKGATLTDALLVEVQDGKIGGKVERKSGSAAHNMLSAFQTRRAAAIKAAASPEKAPSQSFVESSSA